MVLNGLGWTHKQAGHFFFSNAWTSITPYCWWKFAQTFASVAINYGYEMDVVWHVHCIMTTTACAQILLWCYRDFNRKHSKVCHSIIHSSIKFDTIYLARTLIVWIFVQWMPFDAPSPPYLSFSRDDQCIFKI